MRAVIEKRREREMGGGGVRAVIEEEEGERERERGGGESCDSKEEGERERDGGGGDESCYRKEDGGGGGGGGRETNKWGVQFSTTPLCPSSACASQICPGSAHDGNNSRMPKNVIPS